MDGQKIKPMTALNEKEWEAERVNTGDAVLLDVRTQEEYEEKHLKGAQLLDIRQPAAFMEAAQQFDKDKAYFIYCRSGARSAQACQLLDQLGVKATFNLEGGILDWTGPVE